MSSPISADLDHVALSCKGPPLTLAKFYATTIGFEAIGFEEYSQGKAYFPSVRVNASTILDFFSSDGKPEEWTTGLTRGSHMCFAFARSTLDGICERLRESNIAFTEPKARSGARGTGYSIYLEDPEGNNLEFRHYDTQV